MTQPNRRPPAEERPWGYYIELESGAGYKVKRIVVHPGRRLSLQRHAHRSEHWFVLSGSADITLEGDELRLQPGASLDIPAGCAHRLGNSGDTDVAIIEVQRGGYLAEDDIERLEDDFGRN